MVYCTSCKTHIYTYSCIQWWIDTLSVWSGATFSCRPAENLLLTLTYSQMHPVPWDLQGQWFSGQWGPHHQPIKVLIAWQGLFVSVLAAQVWGGAWSHNKILFHCDNLAVVEVWEKQSTRDKALMQLV